MSQLSGLSSQSPESQRLANLSDIRKDVREELQLQLDDFRKRILQQFSELLRNELLEMTELERVDKAMRRAPPVMSVSRDVVDVAKPTPKYMKSRHTTELDKVVRREISLHHSRLETGTDFAKSRQSRDVEIERHDDEEVLAENVGMKQRIAKFLTGEDFGFFITGLVVLNAILIGVETDYTARHGGRATMPGSHRINDAFGYIFTFEVSARLACFGCRQFFAGPDWRWNNFDLFVVAIQWLDECGQMMSGGDEKGGGGMGALRVFKMLRLARIMRLARVIQYVVELQTMITSIAASLKPLCWAAVLFGMLIYMVAVVMTQMVNDKRAVDDQLSSSIEHYFSSLGVAAMSLWQCISGGMDWQDMSEPLSAEVSPFMGVIFIAYIAFSMLAMMNVITGIFVDNASTYAQQDRDAYVVKHVVSLFKKSELNANGDLSWDTFATKLATPELDEFFKAVDVDMTDAQSLFNLVDTGGDNHVSPEELMQGWVRLKGPAKALELSLLSREMIVANELTSKQLAEMTSALNWLCDQQTRKRDVTEGKPPCIGDENIQELAFDSAQERMNIRHPFCRFLPNKVLGGSPECKRYGYELLTP